MPRTSSSGASAGGSAGSKATAEEAAAPAPTAKKTAPAKAVATKAAPASAHTAVAEKAPAAKKAAPARTPGKARLGKPSTAAAASGETYASDTEFLAAQREALLAERETYLEQSRALRAEAESLVTEAEPGDVQFDEESGEGGTTTVDRERDLALSAQALAAVEEITAALDKIEHGRYGICEGCGELIPKARLEAIPFVRLCIACKNGGLSRR
ncbi:MAG: DnaK suppressor protein [Acidimicrobiaceae bacterium]|nr:DnaK suppressor protein [Acidimicrobiaceae bacterium]